MKTAAVLGVSLLAMLGGCASTYKMAPVDAHINRPGLVTPEQARQLEAAMTDRDIANILDADVQAHLPTPVAVAKLEDAWSGPRYYDHGHGGDALRLGLVSSKELEGWEKVIAKEKELRGAQVISAAVVGAGGLSLHKLREAAARMGCELLLVYIQADGQVDNLTDAAALYWTVIGLWIAPGNVYERKTVMQAAIMDCRTGAVLATSAGECVMKEAYAAAYEQIAHGKLDSQVPAKALEDLQKNSERSFAAVVTAAYRKSRASPPTAGQ